MSEHQKFCADLHWTHSFDEKIDFGLESNGIQFCKIIQIFFWTGCKTAKIVKSTKSLKTKELDLCPTGLAWKCSKNLFWTRYRLSRSSNSSQSRLQAIENLQNHQEIHWTGHNSSARRVFADPSAEHFSNFPKKNYPRFFEELLHQLIFRKIPQSF